MSVKIGDSRLGSMETGTGLTRGLLATLHNKCDLVNMSYGEPTSDPNRGRFIDLASDLVNKHGVIFVSSAGNEGPALSTCGAAGGTTDAIIGVGAYVSESMQKAEYAMLNTVGNNQYTWSSRGPTLDGDIGVTITSCGGAIAPVPNWSLQKNQLMNGTSMSSPSACGGIALVLSAMKGNSIPITPPRVRRAMVNSASVIPGVNKLAQGNGLLQVVDMFEQVKAFASVEAEDVRYTRSISGGGRYYGRGVYLRQPADVGRPHDVKLTVDPVFIEGTPNTKKVEFEQRLALLNKVSWVECSAHALLAHGGKTISLRVDPTHPSVSSTPGVHYTEIHVVDEAHPNHILFRVPVIVTIPQPLQLRHHYRLFDLPFLPGTVTREFFTVPSEATWADIVIRPKDIDTARLFVLHTSYILPKHRLQVSKDYSFLQSGRDTAFSINVVGNTTLEVCLAQYWNALGTSSVDIEVTFRGIRLLTGSFNVDAASPVTQITASVGLGREHVSPKITLDHLLRPLTPASYKIRALPTGYRDVLPLRGQIYQMVISYNFELKTSAKVTFRVPFLNGVLYEATHESQLWMIFDSNKRLLATGDSWPDAIKMSEGKYTVRLQLRHESTDTLASMKDLIAYADITLSKSVSPSIHASRSSCVNGKPSMNGRVFQAGEIVNMFVRAPSAASFDSKLDVGPGDVASGTIHFGKDKNKTVASSQRPAGFPITFTFPSKKASPSK